LRLGIVAAEASGDRLGAALIEALRTVDPALEAEGIAGPRMQAAGCRAIAGSEALSVMGIVEVVRHLPQLLALRRDIRAHFRRTRPDVFVGIDAPDFNLGLEADLRAGGIRTVHYVSPTAWAWREGRVRRLRQACDRVLTIFPFEEPWLRARGVDARFVGHPLADAIAPASDRRPARAALALPGTRPLLALLPGSRKSELDAHLPAFVETAHRVTQAVPDLTVAVPVVDARGATAVRAALARRPGLPASIFQGRSSEVLSAADVVLTASGTATIEAMLVGRPMVVAYRLAWLSYLVVRGLIRVPYVSMVNLLADAPLVPEFVQHRMAPGPMAETLIGWLRDPATTRTMVARFAEIGRTLRRAPSASMNAAQAVRALAERRP
jgi:lipid-A-disaccharide synthase